ncbi:hypothetical protein [Chitinophaga sp. ARDCPP14]|uniref:hypothetical protein n=1 Tax=Chitinophaga sp. ARDCPP14 TaxID=3391139 RepID=UPI003F5203AF
MKRTTRIFFSLCLVMMAGLAFTGCGGKDDPAPDNKKATFKFTITVAGADDKDQVDVRVSAGNHDASQYGSPVWKINGVTQGNENVMILDIDNFVGGVKTYVVETVKPFNFSGLSVGVVNNAQVPGAVTISYKAEVDGKVETNVQNVATAASQSYNKEYTYVAK